jgi:predicted MPP superfamily phosphohydrolase
MRNSPFWWVLIAFMVLLDVYFFQALKTVTASATPRTKLIIYSIYWVLSITAMVVLMALPYIHFDKQAKLGRSTVFALIIGLFFAKLIAAFFFMLDDLRRGVQWLLYKINNKHSKEAVSAGVEGISRSAFLSWMGMLAGGGLYGTLVYGFGNRYRYQVKQVQVIDATIPAAFKGLKMVHLSDIHAGSFTNKAAVQKGVQLILSQQPDLILFTGDLVNNVASEMDEYKEVFSLLKAPLGVYSTLGNHDYGDYVKWDSAEAKEANLQQLKQVHADMGWRLLMNEHEVIEKDGQQIALLGVENWSAKARFPKYGNLNKAYAGTENIPFKILLSHDPSHWKEEVCQNFKSINLTLSGHTHGMQFGVEIPGLKWSPVQYVYKEWAGLYQNSGQQLYVNRGFGFLGYPGRVGIMPEITLLELV